MVTRIPYSARTLRRQVLEAKPRAKVEPHGSPDGFGVVRSLRMSKAAANWLEPVLEILGDRRIAGWERDEEGWLIVTFTSLARVADDETEFVLEPVRAVLDS